MLIITEQRLDTDDFKEMSSKELKVCRESDVIEIDLDSDCEEGSNSNSISGSELIEKF